MTGGSLVLDSQGLSRYLDQDRVVLSLVRSALERGADRRDYVLSQLNVKPLTVSWAKQAAQLLERVGLAGHSHVLGAMVAVTALHQEPPVGMLTSDMKDMAVLCGGKVHLVAV